MENYNIRGAALLCTPFDQEKNSRALAQPGINRSLYSNGLLNKLKAKAQEKLDQFCDGNHDTTEFDYKRAMEAETITVFDDAFIAPIYNYSSCWDYYRKTSSIHFMEDVAVPTYIVNAFDGKATFEDSERLSYRLDILSPRIHMMQTPSLTHRCSQWRRPWLKMEKLRFSCSAVNMVATSDSVSIRSMIKIRG